MLTTEDIATIRAALEWRRDDLAQLSKVFGKDKERYMQLIAAIDHALAALDEMQRWEPLPDGEYTLMTIAGNGSTLVIQEYDSDDTIREVGTALDNNIRLCRRVEASEVTE